MKILFTICVTAIFCLFAPTKSYAICELDEGNFSKIVHNRASNLEYIIFQTIFKIPELYYFQGDGVALNDGISHGIRVVDPKYHKYTQLRIKEKEFKEAISFEYIGMNVKNLQNLHSKLKAELQNNIEDFILPSKIFSNHENKTSNYPNKSEEKILYIDFSLGNKKEEKKTGFWPFIKTETYLSGTITASLYMKFPNCTPSKIYLESTIIPEPFIVNLNLKDKASLNEAIKLTVLQITSYLNGKIFYLYKKEGGRSKP